MPIGDRLRSSRTLRTAYHRGRRVAERVSSQVRRPGSFEGLPPEVAVRLVYQMMLRRDPDPGGFADHVNKLRSGVWARDEVAQSVRGSEEFNLLGFTAKMLEASIHSGRCQFIRTLPPASHIVDLGGTHLAAEAGAMVSLGYPYPFEGLTIIDLPSDDRHAIYRSTDGRDHVDTHLGPVTYRYHSMVDLSGYEDESVDLVYSGQSIEHVTPDEGRHVLEEVHRILRPGGYLGLDTPNGAVTRLKQREFIDPDHKVEYTWPELKELIVHAGLEVSSAQGLNYAGRSAAHGTFDQEEAAHNWGLHADLEGCYILAVVARKPRS